MLKLSIREFNKNISKSFKTLPVEITRRGVVVARIVPPDWAENPFWDEVVKAAGAKYMKIAKKDIAGGIKVDKKKARESAKIASERSSVEEPPPNSAPPPPNINPGFPPFAQPPQKLRKKLCPKHSVFSCGCAEK